MNAIASRVEEARQCWNEGDLSGYLRLYDETIKLHGFAPAPMSKTDVSGIAANPMHIEPIASTNKK